MPQFHETIMGKVFYDQYVPEITKTLQTIAKELKRANDLKEKKLEWQKQETNLNVGV